MKKLISGVIFLSIIATLCSCSVQKKLKRTNSNLENKVAALQVEVDRLEKQQIMTINTLTTLAKKSDIFRPHIVSIAVHASFWKRMLYGDDLIPGDPFPPIPPGLEDVVGDCQKSCNRYPIGSYERTKCFLTCLP